MATAGASSTQPGAVTLTQTGIALGTPAYMAPEQAVGEQVDHRADIYALGVVAYEMLTGATPFAGRSAQAMLVAHAMEVPSALADKRQDVPSGLVALVMQCLAKEQADRPQSARAVLTALDTVTTPSPVAAARGRGDAGTSKPVVAVLPLANLSASQDDEYFSDGVSEDIIAQLSRIAELQVIARTSVMRYKKTERRAREIGTDLGATHIIEGSLRRAGQKLRIVAKLIDARSEATLWTDTFNRELADVFTIQSEVAERVADALQAKLALTSRGPRAVPRMTADLDAYDAYLRGRFEWNKGTPDGYRRSIEHCERAIALDPMFAEAHIALATALQWLVLIADDPGSGVERARTHATRALSLDPMSAEAHAALAYINFRFDWNWVEAERLFARAMQLGPSSATTHNHLANFLANMGRPTQAVEAARRSIELDPLWSAAHSDLGWSLFQAGRFSESITACERALELAPDYAPSLYVKGFSLIELGKYADAVAMYERCLKASPDVSLARAGLVFALARGGDVAAARRGLDQLREQPAMPTSWSALAWAHTSLGEIDAAFDAVERMLAGRDPMTVCLTTFAWWDALRRDARFDDILRRLRFPDWSRAVSDARRLAYAERHLSVRAASAKPVIAVLPLTNMSASVDDEFFSDGVTEDIIAQLSKVTSLKVISRTSAMRYKKTEKSIRAIASELGATHIVEGSVRRAGQRLRIVAQLIAAMTDETLWAQTFDREMTDVFAIQSEVAEQIAVSLRATLSPEERVRLEHPATRDVQAYNSYLLGRYHFGKHNIPDWRRSIEYFDQAIGRDPAFALAHAALADSWTWLGYLGALPSREAFPNARDAAQRALALDATLAAAHASLGLVTAAFDWDWIRAETAFRRALELNPSSVNGHLWYAAFVLTPTARHAAAIAEMQTAAELDPVSLDVRYNLGMAYYFARRYEPALTVFQQALDLDRSFSAAHAGLGFTFAALGRYEEAIVEFQHAVAGSAATSEAVAAYAVALAGRRDEARATLRALEERARHQYVIPMEFSLLYTGLGEPDNAFKWLRKAYEERLPLLVAFITAACHDPLRGDPRFAALVHDLGLIPDR
jgi:TolB-like protein/Tfp pilus assembly protein PilF